MLVIVQMAVQECQPTGARMCSQLDKGTSGMAVAGGPCGCDSRGAGAEGSRGVGEGGCDLTGVFRYGVGTADPERHRLATPNQCLARDDDRRFRAGESGLGHPSDDLAAQTLTVEGALAGDDQVGGRHQRLNADRVQYRLNSAHPTTPEQDQGCLLYT